MSKFMDKKLYILFLATWYPNRNNSSYGIFIHRHAQAVQLYANVSVLSIIEDNKIKSGQIESIEGELDGIPHIIIYYRKANKLTGWINYIRALRKAYRLIEKNDKRPDLIHQHVLTRFGLLALWLRRKYQIPYLVSEHWSRYLKEDTLSAYNNPIRKWLTRKVAGRASAITTVSRNLAEAMQNHGIKNKTWQIIPNVVDTEIFYRVVQKKHEKFSLLHVSNLDNRIKNISGILKAVSILKEKRQDFELTLIGGHSDLAQYKAQCAQLDIVPDVHFTGQQTAFEVAKAMQEADIFLLFSRWENQPCVLLEAMACGCPLIASHVGGIPELINNSNGKTIESEDTEALAKAIDCMLDELDAYNRKEIANQIAGTYKLKKIGQIFSELYANILNIKT